MRGAIPIPVLRVRDADGNVNGIPAIRGAKGKSAYELAVENGFEGTEKEWVESLKGKPSSVVSVNGVKPDEKGNVTIEIPDIPDIPDSLPNPNALTIGETSYDGAQVVDMTAAVQTLIDAKIVVGTAEVADGDASTYPEGTLYIVVE